MKVLCIADSSALPRPGIPYDVTWPALIKNSFKEFDLINIFRRNLTTDMFTDGWEGDSLEFYNPEIVILQIGIVDCAPRYLKNASLLSKFIRIMPDFFQKQFWHFFKILRNRSVNNSDVSIRRFKSNLENYFNRCILLNVSKIIVIKICTPGSLMIIKNPAISESVKQYNMIYDELAIKYPVIEIVNPLSSGDMANYVDGYHPSEKGNELVFKSLFNILECLN